MKKMSKKSKERLTRMTRGTGLTEEEMLHHLQILRPKVYRELVRS